MKLNSIDLTWREPLLFGEHYRGPGARGISMDRNQERSQRMGSPHQGTGTGNSPRGWGLLAREQEPGTAGRGQSESQGSG